MKIKLKLPITVSAMQAYSRAGLLVMDGNQYAMRLNEVICNSSEEDLRILCGKLFQGDWETVDMAEVASDDLKEAFLFFEKAGPGFIRKSRGSEKTSSPEKEVRSEG